MITLGDKLRANIAKIKAEEDECKLRVQQARLDAIKQKRIKIVRMFESISNQITADILAGKLPRVKIDIYELKSWIKHVEKGEHVHDMDLWVSFQRQWSEDGIKLKIEDKHDGMGMEAWIEITAEPI